MTAERPTTMLDLECPEPVDFERRRAAGEHVTDLLRQSQQFTATVEAEGHVLGQE